MRDIEIRPIEDMPASARARGPRYSERDERLLSMSAQEVGFMMKLPGQTIENCQGDASNITKRARFVGWSTRTDRDGLNSTGKPGVFLFGPKQKAASSNE
jgi:hypothetical protein